MTWVKGRHTMKAGVAIEYSGEDDFDQINVNSIPGGTNNQNGQFDFRNTSSGRTGLGIADMAGNVWEWTSSSGDASGDSGTRVVRGGSWRDRPKLCRSAYRWSYPSYQKVYNVGFRVVCEGEWKDGDATVSRGSVFNPQCAAALDQG